jgi:hypothetical protein
VGYSLFGRLGRYTATPGRDPREDALTETLAATLEAVPDAARAVAEAWFGDAPAGDLVVKTQRRTEAGERIDLELLFGPVSSPNLLVWLEAKVGARPFREQAERYLRSLANQHTARFEFAWLLPVGVQPVDGTPEGAPVHTWQELAHVLLRWLESVDPAKRQQYGPVLVDQFLRHLEEQTLASTQPLDEQDALALNRYDLALARIEEVISQARAEISRRWGPVVSSERQRLPYFVDHWEPRTSGGRAWPWAEYYFEWNCLRHDARPYPKGEWIIGVGASFPLSNAPSPQQHAAWLAPLYDSRVKVPGC